MDDSFADFQEKKKIKSGPKVVPKDKRNNQKKPLKQSKGQKDIRSLIKKNELVSYSQDFDLVCKQSGVDVDSEQLQLAIALSKSLNEVQSSAVDVRKENQELSSQQRSAKIRTTLQEYGFKVNNTKVLLSLSRNKRKKYNKHSKLLQISSEERQQKIYNKYSEVLASSICNPPNEDSECIYLNQRILYKATNIPYKNIKNDEAFYLKDLIEKPKHKTCFLKDWCNIPGRPVSPKPAHSDINFENMQFSQDELDNILSGSVNTTQAIVYSKQCAKKNSNVVANAIDNICVANPINIIEYLPSCSNNLKGNEDQVLQISDTDEENETKKDDKEICERHSLIKDSLNENNKCADHIKSINPIKILKNKQSLKEFESQNTKIRSLSPDLFDDEVCSIIEDKNDYSSIEINNGLIQDNHYGTSITKYDSCGTVLMDLTECANNIYDKINVYNTDLTKRKSSDLMDITECVKSKHNDIKIDSEQINGHNRVEENMEMVDLTQGFYLKPHFPENKDSGTKESVFEVDDTILYDNVDDLQEPIVICDESIVTDVMHGVNSNEYEIMAHSNQTCNSDDQNIPSLKIIEAVKDTEYGDKDNDINIDLTQVSEKSRESQNYPEFINDDHKSETLEHKSEILNNDNNKDNDIISLKNVSCNNDEENQDENEDIDLTQESEKSFGVSEEDNAVNYSGAPSNGLDNFDYDVGILDNENNSILSVEEMVVSELVGNESDKIDLTQVVEIEEKSNETGYSYVHKNNSKLGKIDNISIDYDELFDEISSEARNVSKHKSTSSEKDVNGSNNSIGSEVFEISDRELNYSIHHSTHEHFNDLRSTTHVGLNRSLSDSFVPTVNLSKPLTPIKEKNNSQPNTPMKTVSNIGDAIIQTPKNNEYIIKTREVSPMADYEAMTTPERNEELEKYGLKPFKRKRAIQLLTYVYNQTHPVIESCSPEKVPSKKLKKDKYSSPKKTSKSPKKCLHFSTDLNKENNIFVVTKETPDIKNIECDPKEWVFQNREKAKVHSCRVPLHIAFHNYVSCRKLLKEAILRYEPVNIDIIHKDLVSYGHKYNPKDLLKFMDRKCITVKTVENNSRNKKI